MRRWIFFLCAVGATAAACGGSMTTVDGNKSTTTLTPDEQNQLCTDVYNYVKSSFSTSDMAAMACGFSGASSTSDPSTCQSNYSACVAKETASMTGITNQPLDCTGFDAQVAQCNTTVAEYTKCLQQEVAAMKSLESQFPLCSQAAAQAAEINAMSQLTSDCLQLAQTCQFLGSSTSGGGPAPDGG